MGDFWANRTTLSMMSSAVISFVAVGVLTALAFKWGWLEGVLYHFVYVGDWKAQTGIWANRWLFGLPSSVALALPATLVTAVLWLLKLDIVKLLSRDDTDQQGSARYATGSEKRKYHKGDSASLIVGSRDSGQPYYFSGPEHLLTVAPNRSGKGVGVIIPNLLTAMRSVICIDPKGENAQITARHRGTFGPVYVLDPFNVSGKHNCDYNPLSDLDPDDPNFVDDAASLASALIITPPNARDQHFDEAARALLRGLIMLAAAAEPPERQNLVTVREYLTYPPEKFQTLLKVMADSPEADGAIASAANVFIGKNPREAASILSTAQEQTNFLDSPQLRKTLKASKLDFSTLKDEIASVYIVLPQSRMESHGRWLRLLIARALQDIERNRTKPPAPVLFLLDEFATIGDLPMIKTAIGLMAGFGLQIWAFLQNWGQLEDLYDKGAHTFAANAGVFQAFSVNDLMTAKQVSDLSGDATVGFTQTTGGANLSTSTTLYGRKLLTPDEAMHLDEGKMFLKFKGTRAILARKITYYQDRRYRGLYDQSDLN
ncbi:TPA: type IV secretory system conjugative DNA transfer family protein [Klebsiella aerogenes]|nr:type IV secretory system conjugative DNA transfer family protein [Klebsiella aerogenes]